MIEKLPESLQFLYGLYLENVKYKEKNSFFALSPEEAFWEQFAIICQEVVWDNKAESELRLSEVFRLYLSIYYEHINPTMTLEEERSFLKILKEKYEKIN